MDKEYEALLNSYRRMFSMIDAIHFNSQNTADVYSTYVNVPSGSRVLPITHRGVSDHRKIRSFDSSMLRMGFIGSEAPYKGLPMLKRVFSRLNSEGYASSLKLNVYGGRKGYDTELCNVQYKGRFAASQMADIYDLMDLLVVPSIWNETFSLITIEALQYGVPVLVSSKVGAKDIVAQYAPQFIFNDEDELYRILHRLVLKRDELVAYNKAVVSSPWQWSMMQHAKDIENVMYKENL